MTCNLLWLPALIGQTGKGSMAGKVTDSSGRVLQGAKIELQPNVASAVSNNQGDFTINGLAPGSYKLLVSVIGFSPFTSEVTVVSGQQARADAPMEVESLSQQVTVTVDRVHGEAEAINRERTAENVLQVLPAVVITSLPNANVADAIGRLPGVTLERDEGEGKYVQIRGTSPRLSNTTIDGVSIAAPESGVRQVKLDTIPSDLVESVEISKTLQANQNGDAIGGSVNLRTKTAGEQPTISLWGQGGYTPILNGRGQDLFSGTIGKRFLKDKKLGVLFGGTYDWNGRGIDDLEPAPTAIQCDPGDCSSNASANAPYYGTYPTEDLREYRYYRTRYGFAGSTDYRINDNNQIYVRGLYSHFQNYGDRWVYTPTINSFTNSPYQGGTDGSMSSNSQIRRPVDVVGSLLAGGQHVSATRIFTWEASGGRSYERDNGYSSSDFGPIDGSSPLNNVQFGLNRTNPYTPKILPQNGVNIYDPTQYFFQDIDVNKTYSPQVNLQGGATLSKSYSLGGHYGTFEFGGRYRNAHKFNEANDQVYNVNDPSSLPMNNFLGNTFYNNYYNKEYTLGPLVNYNRVTQFFNQNPGAFTLDYNKTKQQNDPQNYNMVEQVAAGYLMNTISFGKFRLYTGIRFEGTNLNVTGYKVNIDADGNYVSTSPLRSGAGYVDYLPSVSLRYALTNDSDIRVAYSRSIARPDFGELPPYVTINDKKNTIDVGNPALVPTHSNNYDILYEKYLSHLGAIQGGFYYKQLGKPIYFVNSTVDSGVYQGYTQTQPVNGTTAYVWGFELIYQQRLTFLPSYWSGLGISANYSYSKSKAYGVPNRTDDPALERQAPNTWNISPTYDRGKLSMRVGISYNGANIFSYNYQDGAPLGLKGPNGDNYLYSHLQLDAQGTYRLPKGFSLVVYGLNLNNEVFGFYQGSPEWPIQREFYKPTVGAGVRWSSAPDQK